MQNNEMVPLSIETLSKLEVPGEKTSEKYVLLKSTEIIKALSPEFELVKIEQWGNAKCRHSVSLYNKENDIKIVFDNAFDGRDAFRIRLDADLHIPLNFERQVHMGKPASDMIVHFKDSKSDLIQSAIDAREIYQKLKSTNIPQFIKEDLEDLVFGSIKRSKTFIELDYTKNVQNLNSFGEYLNGLVSAFMNGDYNVVVKTKSGERVRAGRIPKNRYQGLEIQQKLHKYIKKELPLAFI